MNKRLGFFGSTTSSAGGITSMISLSSLALSLEPLQAESIK